MWSKLFSSHSRVRGVYAANIFDFIITISVLALRAIIQCGLKESEGGANADINHNQTESAKDVQI